MNYGVIFLFVVFFYVSYGQPCSGPVININGCCSGKGTSENCAELNKNLLTNISRIQDEHEQKIETILETLNSRSVMRDCQDIQRLGNATTNVYTIYPEGTLGFPVRCDMDTAGGGWTVIQRRKSDSDFFKTWTEYQIGFGNLSENFWLGNEQIHRISKQGWYELRVDLMSMDDLTAYAQYNVFFVGGADTEYKLTVDGYSGNAGDSLSGHNGYKFSTKDNDNDAYSGNCAQKHIGAWWYESCHSSNLNGKYGAPDSKGPRWHGFKGDEPMKETEMKIRRWKPDNHN